jgi:hypothetical protein
MRYSENIAYFRKFPSSRLLNGAKLSITVRITVIGGQSLAGMNIAD